MTHTVFSVTVGHGGISYPPLGSLATSLIDRMAFSIGVQDKCSFFYCRGGRCCATVVAEERSPEQLVGRIGLYEY